MPSSTYVVAARYAGSFRGVQGTSLRGALHGFQWEMSLAAVRLIVHQDLEATSIAKSRYECSVRPRRLVSRSTSPASGIMPSLT
jgi:hypothetical protein